MLVKFSVENFLSFKEPAEFMMVAGTAKQFSDEHLYVVNPNLNLLKTAVIYGANASGKTNFVRALAFLQYFIVESELRKGQPISKLKPFKLDANSLKGKSSFEIDFLMNNKIYSYHIELDEYKIYSENLSEIKGDKSQPIYSRSENMTFSHRYFKDKKSRERLELIAEDLLPNQLFLSIANRRRVETIEGATVLMDCFSWFQKVLVIIFPEDKYQELELRIGFDSDFQNVFTSYLQEFDTDIENVKLEKIDIQNVNLPMDIVGALMAKLKTDNDIGKNNKFAILPLENELYVFIKKKNIEDVEINKLITLHKTSQNQTIPFELSEESDGTRRLMDLMPALMYAHDKVFIIDEVNRSLHPHLTREYFVKFINLLREANSQVISTTHETTIMDSELFRRDEIWFVEKNRDTKTSQLFSLEEFKPRSDLVYNKAYLQGRFGALPCFREVE